MILEAAWSMYPAIFRSSLLYDDVNLSPSNATGLGPFDTMNCLATGISQSSAGTPGKVFPFVTFTTWSGCVTHVKQFMIPLASNFTFSRTFFLLPIGNSFVVSIA